MKNLLLIFAFLLTMSASGQIFSGHTKHKPIKRMTAKDIRITQQGGTMYSRVNGKVIRNSYKWGQFKKPRYFNDHRPKDRRKPIFDPRKKFKK